MEITVTAIHVSAGDKKVKTIEVQKDTTLRKIFDLLGFSKACVNYNTYYAVNDQYFYQKLTLPYLIVEGVLEWNQPATKVKITDFFSTHNIKDNSLQVLYGYPHADGPMFPSFLAMWQFVYGIIQNIDPVLGVGGTLFSAFAYVGKKIHKFHVSKKLANVAPSAVFSLIASRGKWNVAELANMIGIEQGEAKNLLKTCGYYWDPHNLIYCESERTKTVIEVLNKVRWE